MKTKVMIFTSPSLVRHYIFIVRFAPVIWNPSPEKPSLDILPLILLPSPETGTNIHL